MTEVWGKANPLSFLLFQICRRKWTDATPTTTTWRNPSSASTAEHHDFRRTWRHSQMYSCRPCNPRGFRKWRSEKNWINQFVSSRLFVLYALLCPILVFFTTESDNPFWRLQKDSFYPKPNISFLYMDTCLWHSIVKK